MIKVITINLQKTMKTINSLVYVLAGYLISFGVLSLGTFTAIVGYFSARKRYKIMLEQSSRKAEDNNA